MAPDPESGSAILGEDKPAFPHPARNRQLVVAAPVASDSRVCTPRWVIRAGRMGAVRRAHDLGYKRSESSLRGRPTGGGWER